MELVFATNNAHKLREVKEMAGSEIHVLGLDELDFHEDIAETEETLEGNALLKARYIHQRFQKNVFADDTGLEVEALNGRPGVYSARYAGEGCSFEDNVRKLLLEMKGQSNRKARFRTVIALILEEKEYTFEGIVDGIITRERSGVGGFGYDPVFRPDGYTISFAEMEAETKNNISHRGRAMQELFRFLLSKYA